MEKPQKPKGTIVKQEQEIINFLTEAFPQNSKTSLKSFLQNNKVEVNGNVITKHNHVLNIGDTVNIVKPTFRKKIDLGGLKILFEDDHIVIIDKVEGLLSISGNNKEEETAFRILSQYVKEKDEKNRIFVVHRLDKDTSGVMMYAKSQKTQELLQKNWSKIILERKYIVVVEGYVAEANGIVKSWLTESSTYMMYSSFEDNGGQPAELSYKRLKHTKHFSMLEVSLETGRKNQIRVQMQALGHPVAGDKKYGAKTNLIKRLALHAKTLYFIHPFTEKEMRFDVPVPTSFFKLVQ